MVIILTLSTFPNTIYAADKVVTKTEPVKVLYAEFKTILNRLDEMKEIRVFKKNNIKIFMTTKRRGNPTRR